MVAQLLDNLKSTCANLVTEVTERLSPARIQRVLQGLLAEQVPIRDLEAILEALSEAVEHTDNVENLTEQARAVVGRRLCQQHAEPDGKLVCLSLSRELEEQLGQYVGEDGGLGVANIPPSWREQVTRSVTGGLEEMRRKGRKPVVICAPAVRGALRRLVAPVMSEAVILGYNEIDSVEVESVGKIGI
jgi:flagellar biosynthesis protein FlhA